MHVRRRYHLGVPGLVYVFLTLLVALGAFNSQNNLLFWAFGFSLALLVVSGLLSGAMLMGLEVQRQEPAPGAVGVGVRVHYRVTNRTRRIPAFALTITEIGGTSAGPARASRKRHGAKGGTEAAAFDWSRLISQPIAFIAHVGPGQTVHAEALARADRRGVARMTSFLVTTAFPFGIVKKSLLFLQETEVLVYPLAEPVPPAFLQHITRQGDRGMAPTRRAGPSDEFFAMREYVAGDSPRAIAWRLSARGRGLLVRQSAAPSPVRLWVWLRLDRGAEDRLTERAISLAAGIVEAALGAGMETGLLVPSPGIAIPARDSRQHRDCLLGQLARLDPAAAPAPMAATPLRTAIGARSLVVVVHAGPIDQSEGPPSAAHVTAGADEPFAGRAGEAPRADVAAAGVHA
jgi:uncharacterized protein (DUF58 family)